MCNGVSDCQLINNDIILCYLFHRAAGPLQSIQRLKLNNNELSATIFMVASLPTMKCYFCNLCYLSLSRNPLGVTGIQCFENAVCTGSLYSLAQLVIQQTLTSDQDINGALLTTLCDSLSTHCPQLNHFDASHNKLGIPGAQAIGNGLHHINKQEKGFSLACTQ